MIPSRPLSISCDPSIYAAGGWYGGPAGEPGTEAGSLRTVAGLYGPYAYSRPIRADRIFGPPGLVERILAHSAWVNDVFTRGPASSLVQLRECRLRGRSIHLRTRDGWRPLHETQRFVDLPYLGDPEPGLTAERLADDVAYLHLGSAGSFNYGHFLVDDLARLRAVPLCPRPAGQRLCVLMTSHGEVIDRVRDEAVRALCGDVPDLEIRFLDPAASYDVATLYYPSPISLHPALKNPAALDDLAARVRDAVARAGVTLPGRRSGRGRARLYVFRRPERGRALENWSEIEALLRRRRLRIIDPESLSFLEQAAHFGDAALVVGQMGASMTNTLFCRPGARILHLAPDDWVETFYWDLAAVRGHHYAACYGPAHAADAAHLADFRLDPARLDEALERLG